MGKGKRQRPKLLGKKLRAIREKLDLSQNGMLRHLGLDDEFTQAELSAYERGVREPPLHVILRYSQAAHIWVNALIDDTVEIPKEFPMKEMQEGIQRYRAKKAERK
ncbi:MAG: helix-turn-helix transcriptional regulator [Acidobacteria bacterium]|nr:helix-turn-helix transcriptional regulator [Acidobacteriota bacterium]